jgi:hypothetical protein
VVRQQGVTTVYEEGYQSLEGHFPIIESFPDFSGKLREFVIDLRAHPGGYFLRATEKRRSGSEGGYSFAAYSPTDPSFALGQLRDKIRQGLATRYLYTKQHGRSLSHDRLQGHIGSGGVVVDGEFIAFDELWILLETYEGFQFSLKIADPYDEL